MFKNKSREYQFALIGGVLAVNYLLLNVLYVLTKIFWKLWYNYNDEGWILFKDSNFFVKKKTNNI